eukprot:m51a1_g2724 hypothetical protein (618) ;mRNA; f:862873-865345
MEEQLNYFGHATFPGSLACSPTNVVAAVTDQSVGVFSLGAMNMCSVARPAELRYEVGDSLMAPGQIEKQTELLPLVRHASWSQAQHEPSGGCLLAVVTGDQRVHVYAPQSSSLGDEWERVAELSQMLYDKYLAKWSPLPKRRPGRRAKQEDDGILSVEEQLKRIAKMTPLCTAWSTLKSRSFSLVVVGTRSRLVVFSLDVQRAKFFGDYQFRMLSVHKPPYYPAWTLSLAFAPASCAEEEILAAGSGDGRVVLLKPSFAEDGSVTFDVVRSIVSSPTFRAAGVMCWQGSAPSRRLAFSQNSYVRVWKEDAAQDAELMRTGTQKSSITGIAFTQDGETIYVASADGDVKSWEQKDGEVVETVVLQNPAQQVQGLDCSVLGSTLIYRSMTLMGRHIYDFKDRMRIEMVPVKQYDTVESLQALIDNSLKHSTDHVIGGEEIKEALCNCGSSAQQLIEGLLQRTSKDAMEDVPLPILLWMMYLVVSQVPQGEARPDVVVDVRCRVLSHHYQSVLTSFMSSPQGELTAEERESLLFMANWCKTRNDLVASAESQEVSELPADFTGQATLTCPNGHENRVIIPPSTGSPSLDTSFLRKSLISNYAEPVVTPKPAASDDQQGAQ